MLKLCFLILALLASSLYSKFSIASFDNIIDDCEVDKEAEHEVLESIKNKDLEIIKSLSNCLKFDHRLIFQAALINPETLLFADDVFRKDENFIYRLLKVNSEILKYISPDLSKNQFFFERATYIDRESLKYADSSLLDNKYFMKKMIELDSENYIYASNRIKMDKEISKIAFLDNGMLIKYAPQNIKNDNNLIKIALKSDIDAHKYIDKNLKLDKETNDLLKSYKKLNKDSENQIFEYIKKHFTYFDERKNIGLAINKNNHLFKKNILINRNFVTKWQKFYKFQDGKKIEELKLIPANIRNSPKNFISDLKKYPDLVEKITHFLKKRNVDENTIKELSLTYLWKIKQNPLTIAFNVYLIRDSNDIELAQKYINATSLTAIAQKKSGKWRLTVVEAILDREIKFDIGYENGHKKYVLQDLYFNKNDNKNPNLIFLVEDKFRNYFEIFAEANDGRYKLIHQIDPIQNNKSIDIGE